MTMQRVDSHLAVLASASKDGELIAGPMRHLGYHTVRGSSSRQGARALREMLRISKDYSLGLTPDGPKGPAGTIHPGIFEIALLAKIPIIALKVESKKEWVLNTWDSFRIPKPFSKVRVLYSQPFHLKSKEDIAVVKKEVIDFTGFQYPTPADSQ